MPPLQVPREAGSVEEVAASGAARLFVQQAAMVRPGFAVTAEQRRRHRGHLRAAGRAAAGDRAGRVPGQAAGPRALLARLGHSLDLAAADVGQPSRQQTLRNAIAWSYDLLAATWPGRSAAPGCSPGAATWTRWRPSPWPGPARRPDPIRWSWPPGCWTSA